MMPIKNFFSLVLLILSISACGTILYPERKGQIHGRIDPAVVALDGIGLLFYAIPGVIAFAVDFTTGAIYLPTGKHRSSNQRSSDHRLSDAKDVDAPEPIIPKPIMPELGNANTIDRSPEVIRLNRPITPAELPEQLKKHSSLPVQWQLAVVSPEIKSVAWLTP